MEATHDNSPYYFISKFALWGIAMTLFGVFIGSLWNTIHGDDSATSHLISACQALSFIAVSVMGYHLSRPGMQQRLNKMQAQITGSSETPTENP